MTAHMQLYRDAANLWRWRLVARNGRTLCDSGEGYSTKAKARYGIRAACALMAQVEVVEA